MSNRLRTFRCPNCGELVFENAESCKSCGHCFEPGSPAQLCDHEDEVNLAFDRANSANLLSNGGFGLYGVCMLAILVVSGRVARFINPTGDKYLAQTIVLGVLTLFAFLVAPVLVAIPALWLRWRARFGRLEGDHPTLDAARGRFHRARRKWLILVIVWVHLSLLPALLLLFRQVAGG